MILLDTNVISETQKPGGDRRVKELVESRRHEIHLSAIAMGEILYGVALLDPGARRRLLEDYYATLRGAFADRILPVTGAVAELWAGIRASGRRAGRALPVADGLIAATALHHDLTLWTRNTRDFAGTGVRLFNPWED